MGVEIYPVRPILRSHSARAAVLTALVCLAAALALRYVLNETIGNALLAQAAMSLATLVPATPGGIGTEQALLVYAFRDVGVARSTLLAFSVGMKLTLTVVNVIVGFTAIFLTLGTVRYGSVVSKPPGASESADGSG